MTPLPAAALEQLASLHADAGDTVQLDAAVARLRQVAPDRAATDYYAAVAAFLHGDAAEAVELARAGDRDRSGIRPGLRPDRRRATRGSSSRRRRGRRSKRSLTFDAHDSTAYTNLGLLELAAGNRPAAAQLFAEALWLAPESQTARQGLSQSQ